MKPRTKPPLKNEKKKKTEWIENNGKKRKN